MSTARKFQAIKIKMKIKRKTKRKMSGEMKRKVQKHPDIPKKIISGCNYKIEIQLHFCPVWWYWSDDDWKEHKW